jgi:proline-specific peptidase
MYTRIVRPMAQSSKQHAPVLVCHGGPGVPSDYLWPLEKEVPYRTIIFYDQLGCGRSSVADEYSIERSIDDIEAILKKLGLTRFHLYGQSFGGILAHAAALRFAGSSTEVLSLALSSAPANVATVERVAEEPLDAMKQQQQTTLSPNR